MTPAPTTSRRGGSAKQIGKTNDFSGVDCVVIDSPIQKSRDSGWYCHVWVDGDKSNTDNHKYLSVTEDQADWISSNQNKILKPIDWMVRGGKTWLCPTPENTQVFTSVAPDSNPFEEDDVDRLYEQEDDHEFQLTEALLLDVQNLKKRFPEISHQTIWAARCTVFIQNNKR